LIQDWQGCKPLHLAIQNNDVNTAKVLFRAGPNVVLANLDGYTPVDFCILQQTKNYINIDYTIGNLKKLEDLCEYAASELRREIYQPSGGTYKPRKSNDWISVA